jgi:hypothetical protein
MNETALTLTAPTAIWRLLVRCGLLLAIAIALAGNARLFEASRECRGAFSSDFTREFDVHSCKLTIKAAGAEFKVSIPLP